jgi:single-strand DNA-binding protein
MSKSLNVAMIIGNLTRDPEMRFTPNGKAVTSFAVATNREWNVEGQAHEEAEFHNVVAWTKLGEICNQLLRKGTKVYISGRLQTRTWDDAQGAKHYRTEIVADEMIVLSPKSFGDAAPVAATEKAEPAEPISPAPTGEEDVVIDEKTGMPF